MIKQNAQKFREEYGENVPMEKHPIIRSREACYASSSFASGLAKKYNTRLHILHISTKEELDLFRNDIPMKEKHITAEACVHHLWFDSSHYESKGNLIKCNPAIKASENREAIWKAINEGRIDVIATDHAPHTWEEKTGNYVKSHAGLPLVQHSLQMMLDKHDEGYISIPKIADMMAHRVAELFRIEDRGYIREGYFADLVLVKKETYQVKRENLLYKCGWSPLLGLAFTYSIDKTMVNGAMVYENGLVQNKKSGQRLLFAR
jgi:dihydroorotase